MYIPRSYCGFSSKIYFLPSLTPDKGYNYNTYFKYANEDPKAGESKSEAEGKLPTLNSPQAWAQWKEMLDQSMLSNKGIDYLAKYLHCKVNPK